MRATERTGFLMDGDTPRFRTIDASFRMLREPYGNWSIALSTTRNGLVPIAGISRL